MEGEKAAIGNNLSAYNGHIFFEESGSKGPLVWWRLDWEDMA